MARTTAAPKQPATPKAPDHGVSADLLASCRASFAANPANRMAMNACTAGNVDEIAINRQAVAGLDWHFSHEVETGQITHQRQAGFCWLFAALNWLRVEVMATHNLEHLEFSQNHLIFWDRFEKANRFLTAMVALRDKPTSDRMVHFFLHEPCPDGGEWHMVGNLIRKYGLLPKQAMADTANLVDSKFLNKVVDAKLRQAAARIFGLQRDGAPEADIEAFKAQTLIEVYRILAILMGEPPATFDFTYRDKKKKFHAHRGLTPHGFYERFVGVDLTEYAWIMSAPLPDTPYEKTYYVEHLQNVVEGRPGTFLNLPMPVLKGLAVKALKAKEAVFFGCDVLQASHRKLGILDPEVLDYDLLFATDFAMPRADRMQFLQARLTHDMVLLGVDLEQDRPLKWKVENSWGDEPGNKGIFLMTDAWFDEHVYAVVVHQKHLTPAHRKLLTQPPTVLAPWHPLA